MTAPLPRPPRLPRALVRLLVRGEAHEVVLGDLDEDFRDQRARGLSRRAAARRYWRQALGSAVSLARERFAPAAALDEDAPPEPRFTFGGYVLQDVRHGLRLLVRYPGFAAAAVATLALGIGANTAIFTVAWHAILKPLPYPQAERLVSVWEVFTTTGTTNTVMPANYRDWQREATSFEALAAYTYFRGTSDLTGHGEPEQWRVRHVTEQYFEVFGMTALAGRTLDARDGASGRTSVVLSESTWRRRFNGDAGTVGQEIQLAGRPALVVGVMPAAFELAGGRVDAWSAFALPAEQPGQRLAAHYLGVVARLKPGVDVPQADLEIRAIAARAAERFPRENGMLSATVESIADQRGASVRSGLTILALGAGAVLLIACANLGSLQFSRTAARAREFGIRTSLGASRRRLVAQLVTEAVVLAAIGGAAGLTFGAWLLHALQALSPTAVRSAVTLRPDLAVTLYTAALALASALAFAIWPAWRAGGRAAAWLGRRTDTGDRGTRRIRGGLVAAQIALAAMLLVSAATLMMSLRNVLRVDPGFDPSGVLTFDVSLPPSRFGTFASRDRLLKDLTTELQALPGVTAACAINEIPFDAQGSMTYVPEGQARAVNAAPRNVTAGCLELLRMRVIRGRTFTGRESARAAIVTERFAGLAWPGGDPIGRRVHVGMKEGPLIEIVGVVADTRQESLERLPQPQLYEIAVEASAFWPQRIVARTAGPPESAFAGVRAAVRRVDPDQPVANLRTLDAVVSATVAGRQFDLSLVSTFSAIALLLAAVGIYGLLAQTVTQRSGEIGIRMALGATPQSVVRLVMTTAWVCVGAGSIVGLGGAMLAARLLERFVYGVSATEPALYAAVTLTLAVLALAAAWIPSRRAARVDPVRTLNQM